MILKVTVLLFLTVNLSSADYDEDLYDESQRWHSSDECKRVNPSECAPRIVLENNPAKEAALFKKAHHNKEKILAILTKRTEIQRLEVALKYKDKNNKDLREHLKHKWGLKLAFHNIADTMILDLISPIRLVYANHLKDHSLTQNTIVDIFGPMSNTGADSISSEFYAAHNKLLMDHIIGCNLHSNFSPQVRNFWVNLTLGNRNEYPTEDGFMFDPSNDAADCLLAAMRRHGPDEAQMANILSTRTVNQISDMMTEFQSKVTEPYKLIQETKALDLKTSFLQMLRLSKNTPKYYARRLFSELTGEHANNNLVVWTIILGHLEIDLDLIMKEFQNLRRNKLSRPLSTIILENVKDGIYRTALLSLIDFRSSEVGDQDKSGDKSKSSSSSSSSSSSQSSQKDGLNDKFMDKMWKIVGGEEGGEDRSERKEEGSFMVEEQERRYGTSSGGMME